MNLINPYVLSAMSGILLGFLFVFAEYIKSKCKKSIINIIAFLFIIFVLLISMIEIVYYIEDAFGG
jgi:succinate dehydrogenase hydrophobic anchor subunit